MVGRLLLKNLIRKTNTKIVPDCMAIFRPSCSGTNEVVALRQPRRPRGFFTRGDSTALERFSGPSMSLPNFSLFHLQFLEIYIVQRLEISRN